MAILSQYRIFLFYSKGVPNNIDFENICNHSLLTAILILEKLKGPHHPSSQDDMGFFATIPKIPVS